MGGADAEVGSALVGAVNFPLLLPLLGDPVTACGVGRHQLCAQRQEQGDRQRCGLLRQSRKRARRRCG
jgi:hypothetical protein